MKIKKYSNVIGDAKKHPKFEQYAQEHLARLRLAEIIHNERITNNLTMKQLAEKSYTTPAVISRIENAQVSAGIDVIYKIFKALNKKELKISF